MTSIRGKCLGVYQHSLSAIMDLMSFRTLLSLFTVILLAIIIFFSRHEILHALELLESVNLWILVLILPLQLLVYYAAGETIFSYLRSKKSIDELNPPTLARMALEMNFVNHVLPSAGVSGASYMNWRLGHYKVSAPRATMAQVVRFAMVFSSFITLLLVSVFVITIDGNINRWILLVSSLLVTVMVSAILLGIFLLSSHARIVRFSRWLHVFVGKVVKRVTFGRKSNPVTEGAIEHFFNDLHRDYVALLKDKGSLKKPFIWGLIFNAGDAGLFFLTFLALGSVVNPAVILIAYGLASMAGFFVITPGGTGAYEAIMVSFLAIAGIASGVAIAGILLTRVIILLCTIGLGYVFYQDALIRYGKGKHPSL